MVRFGVALAFVPALGLALGLALGPASCGRDELPSLREQARGILAAHCGECHAPERKTALAGALAIFDLSERDWARRMDERQLRSAAWRLGEPIPPEGRTNDVSDRERAAFGRYVELELVQRARARAR
jgi:hypothetical protein